MEIPIDKILEKYTVSAPDRSVRQKAVSVISDVVGVSVSFESVSYQNGRIHVDASPLLRSQLHIHKEVILSSLEKELKKARVKDLR